MGKIRMKIIKIFSLFTSQNLIELHAVLVGEIQAPNEKKCFFMVTLENVLEPNLWLIAKKEAFFYFIGIISN
jgi:hypothetical protein